MATKYKQFGLLDIASISGSRVRKFEGVKQYVATADIDLNCIVGGENVIYEDRPSRADLVMSEDDVLFAKMKNTIKVLAGSPEVEDKIFSTGFYILTPKENISKKYLYFFMLGSEFNRQKDLYSSGATMAAIGNKGLKRIKVSIPVDSKGSPDITEQDRIVAILEEAEKLKQKRAESDKKIVTIIPALFDKMFGNPESTEFSTKRLIEIVDPKRPITYGILKPGAHVENGIPYVRVLDIKYSHLHVSQLKRTSKLIANQYKRSILNPGDLLITIRGTVGRTCVVPSELDGANITQDTARLAITPEVESRYVMEFLNSTWAQNWMNSRMVGQAVKGINLGDLKELPIPIPPIDLQRRFVKQVAEILILKEKQKQLTENIDTLFSSLMSNSVS